MYDLRNSSVLRMRLNDVNDEDDVTVAPAEHGRNGRFKSK